MFQRNTLELICCPACGTTPLHLSSDSPGDTVTTGWVACPSCDTIYPIEHGILDLLPGWPRRERPREGFGHDTGTVRLYEGAYIRRNPISPLLGLSLAQEMAMLDEMAPVVRGETVLDVACGTGLYTRALARATVDGPVIGLDLSWPMLSRAARLAAHEHDRVISLVRAEAQTLPLRPGSCDVVNCAGGLHLFADLDAFLERVAHVLRPGGLFRCMTLIRSDTPAGETVAWLARQLNVTMFEWTDLNQRLERAGLQPAHSSLHRTVLLFVAARTASQSSSSDRQGQGLTPPTAEGRPDTGR